MPATDTAGWVEPAVPTKYLDAEDTGRTEAGKPVVRQIVRVLALADLIAAVDGLEGSTDGIEGLLTSIRDNTDGVEATLTGLDLNTDEIEQALSDMFAELAQKLEAGDVTGLSTSANQLTGLTTLAAVRDRLPAALAADGSLAVNDTYTSDGYDFATSDGTVQTLDLGAAFDLVWVRCEGATGFAKITGTPADDDGAFCEDGVQQPITRRTQTVKVWAPTGTKIYGWAYGA